jgi:hypothetical protein
MTVRRGQTPTSTPAAKISQRGCFAIIAGALIAMLLVSLLFTFLFNVVSGIFNGPIIGWFEGFCLLWLITIIGAAFKKAT